MRSGSSRKIQQLRRKTMKTVYTCFCTDIIHEGHLNIINEAKKLGKVVIGALSDKALIRYNKFPTLSQEERVKLYRSIEGVEEVIIQNDMLYDDIIEQIKPDYIIHGDNWKYGPPSAIRMHVMEKVLEYGGKVVDCLRYVCILKRGHSFQLYHNPVYEHVNNVISNDIAVFVAYFDWHLCLDIETCF